jgi:hypothetical protein
LPAGLDARLVGLLGQALLANDALIRLRTEGPLGELGPGVAEAPGLQVWRELGGVANHALPADDPLRHWLDLGLAIGRAEVRVREITDKLGRVEGRLRRSREPLDRIETCMRSVEAAYVQEMEAELLVAGHAASDVPGIDRRRIAALRCLSGITKVPKGGRTLRDVLAEQGTGWLPDLGHYPPELFYLWCVPAAHESIREALLRLPKGQQTRREMKPSWRHHEGELYYDGVVIKRVGIGKATNVVCVLDAFEQAGWPNWIADPCESGAQSMHETIRSLNKRLNMISFHADGTGNGIRWKPLTE